MAGEEVAGVALVRGWRYHQAPAPSVPATRSKAPVTHGHERPPAPWARDQASPAAELGGAVAARWNPRVGAPPPADPTSPGDPVR